MKWYFSTMIQISQTEKSIQSLEFKGGRGQKTEGCFRVNTTERQEGKKFCRDRRKMASKEGQGIPALLHAVPLFSSPMGGGHFRDSGMISEKRERKTERGSLLG